MLFNYAQNIERNMVFEILVSDIWNRPYFQYFKARPLQMFQNIPGVKIIEPDGFLPDWTFASDVFRKYVKKNRKISAQKFLYDRFPVNFIWEFQYKITFRFK